MKTNTKSIKKVLAMVVVLVISAGCLFGCGSSPKSVAKSFAEAFKKLDAKKMVSLMPEKVVEKSAEMLGGKDEMVKSTQEMFDEMKKGAEEEGYKWSDLKYEIGEVKDVDKAEVEQYEKQYDIKIDEAKTVDIKFTMPGVEEPLEDAITVVKIGSSWYVLDMGM